MTASERRLQYILSCQGILYLCTSLWGLVATRSFLAYTNPGVDLFEARSFAALSLVLTIYFLVGATRTDLLRPAAFLGLGSAVAVALVELFHLPAIGWSLLWVDFLLEVTLAGFYIAMFFFRKEESEKKTEEAAIPTEEPTPEPPPIEGESAEHEERLEEETEL